MCLLLFFMTASLSNEALPGRGGGGPMSPSEF